MNNAWKWILGIVLVLVILFAPFAWSLFLPYGGYGMMGYGHVPMMYGGYGFFGIGMIFMGLVPLGLLVLIVLGIIWLVRAIGRQNVPKNN